MKKHINVDDFLELSEEHRQHLRNITNFENIDNYFYNLNNKYYTERNSYIEYFFEVDHDFKTVRVQGKYCCIMYPCFTIGDMIEMLSNKFTEYLSMKYDKCSKDWECYIESFDCDHYALFDCELCDTLWDLIKWCLNEELL